ncbi:hypothetical protein PENTCL1PPCAC_17244 [Pristionchus entomophagus]|uniref:UDP-glucuronosyltransferase n=1 Tax=Pristionchus entomophagus TaxID=358040 RepID=A0AAV5TL24_9BILA|nr:hypothetical protein PENTCL1PPCAC_17244 [Pristionchus entomophagus]
MRLLLFLSFLSTVQSLKFLVFSSQFARSHANYIARISDVLVEAGHEVTITAPMLTTSFTGPLAKKAKVITIPPCEQAKAFDEFLNLMSANLWVMKHHIQMFMARRKINPIWGHACLNVLDQPGLFDSLKAEQFDAAFSESADVCGPVLFHLLGIDKWAVTESVAIRDGGFYVTQTPSNPSYVPSMMGNAGEEMTFRQRLSNTISYVVADVMIGVVYSDIDAVIRERIPDLPPIRDILASNSLVFLNAEPLVDFPKPMSARIIDIGGIAAAEEHKPLNKTWSSILDLRPNTILLSFGSMAKAYTMPDEYKHTIKETFKKFPDVTFIWKYEKPQDNISAGIPNLIESTWVPQSDLLHDPRLTVFITHCGQGSITESIDAGIPVIVIPVLADQLRNSHQVERNGIGLRLEKEDLAREGRLAEAITEILSNEKYRQKARKKRKMVAERPFSMKEIFVRNMEFLAKHGPLRQLDHYGKHLSFVQYYLIDVISFVCCIIGAACTIMFLIIRALIRKLFGLKMKKE